MSVAYCISHENDEIMDTDYFVEQLKKKWPDVRIHFITDSKDRSLFQFETPDDFWILGDFYGKCVWYQGNGLSDVARFVLWYRSIVPTDWQLRYYDSGLYFDLMFIPPGTTEEQIIGGFDIPFDPSKYQ